MNPTTSTGLTRRPRLGFLGTGWIGRRRLAAIAQAEIAEVVALADPSPQPLEEAAALAPKALRLRSFDELLDLELDGVVIATPSALHAKQSIAALARGKAVFCQKPLGRNAAEVCRITEAARDANRLLGVDLSYRHTRALQVIRTMIHAGDLGEIFSVELVFHNAYGPQAPWFYDARLSGGGCIIDLGIHLVDAALWILESSVVHVSGRVFAAGKPVPAGSSTVEDFATARLDLATGAAVQLACSWRLHAGRDAVIEARFHGTKGGAAMRNLNGSFHDFRAERFLGTRSEVLVEPPDDWGGRAAVAWVQQLTSSPAYDPAVERQMEVAKALDAIYGERFARRHDTANKFYRQRRPLNPIASHFGFSLSAMPLRNPREWMLAWVEETSGKPPTLSLQDRSMLAKTNSLTALDLSASLTGFAGRCPIVSTL